MHVCEYHLRMYIIDMYCVWLHSIGTKYIVSFPSNPGKLRQPAFLRHLDGPRPTLYTPEIYSSSSTGSSAGQGGGESSVRGGAVRSGSSLQTIVYPDGFSGENVEYFTEKCMQVGG